MRLKKQEEKRQKRLKKDTASHQGTEGAVADSTMPEESAPEGIGKE